MLIGNKQEHSLKVIFHLQDVLDCLECGFQQLFCNDAAAVDVTVPTGRTLGHLRLTVLHQENILKQTNEYKTHLDDARLINTIKILWHFRKISGHYTL
jgi:hypothetical protein